MNTSYTNEAVEQIISTLIKRSRSEIFHGYQNLIDQMVALLSTPLCPEESWITACVELLIKCFTEQVKVAELDAYELGMSVAQVAEDGGTQE